MNVLRDSLATLRAQHLARCRASFYSLAGWSLLLWVDWRVALGVFLIAMATFTAAKAGGSS